RRFTLLVHEISLGWLYLLDTISKQLNFGQAHRAWLFPFLRVKNPLLLTQHPTLFETSIKRLRVGQVMNKSYLKPAGATSLDCKRIPIHPVSSRLKWRSI
ncbi:hypothetical protein A6J39_001010, partial [Legionella anisa]